MPENSFAARPDRPVAASHGKPEGTPPLASAAAEEQLLQRCRAGDTGAFDAIVERHQDRIYNVCFWMLGDSDAAADAAQDAFIRAFRGLHNFRGESSFSTWLHRIAVNTSLDALNRRKRAPLPFSTLQKDDDGREHDPPDRSETPPEAALRRERRRKVEEALAELPEHYRVVLVLFDMQGHSYEDVAGLLGVPMGTVKSRLNRARLALRNKIEPCRELFGV